MEIKRDYYLNQLLEARGNGLVKIITGIRRCGKSYLLDPILKNRLLSDGIPNDHIIKLDLDERENRQFLNPDALDRYIRSRIKDSQQYYLLLDEIQEVEDFESVLIGFMHMANVEIYVTGSNSKFLSSDIVTEFRGRGDEIHLYPLCFSEFCSAYQGDKASALAEYYAYGGLPQVVLAPTDDTKMKRLASVRDNIYLNDIVSRNNIINCEKLKILANILASNVGSLTNPLKMSNNFRERNRSSTMSDKTIYNYLEYLRDAFIIERARRYDVRGKRYFDTPQKYYFSDLGIRNAFLDFRQSEELSHEMENAIFLELRRRGYSVDVGSVETREGDAKKQLEIDFVANQGNNRIYIQSALEMKTAEKVQQEQRSLAGTDDFFKKIIIVGNETKRSRYENGIIIMSIYDFLTDPNSLDF